MTLLPPGMKVNLGLGYTDMRKGIDGLAMLVQGVLRHDPICSHLFVFLKGTPPPPCKPSPGVEWPRSG